MNQENNQFNINRSWNQSYTTYIWLGKDLRSIDSRFQRLISPSQWNCFTTANDCEKFLADQQLDELRRVYLISTYPLASQLYTDETATKISVAYIYSDHEEFFDKWINKFKSIRGIYKNFDILYEQFSTDLTKNIDEQLVQEPDKVRYLFIEQLG